MTERRQIIIELRKGNSIRRISRDLKVHREIIRSLKNICFKNDWLNPDSTIPSEGEITKVLKKSLHAENKLDCFIDQITAWKSEGYTAVVIQRLLKEQFKLSTNISTLRKYIQKNCPSLPEPVMVRQTIPGKIMEVDFGLLGSLWDTPTNKFKKAWVFSARLCHSRKTYREIVQRQDIATFLACHIHAFEHFGGVPSQVVVDNLKAAVIKSTLDNDHLNKSFRELAEYYGFMISPCMPRTPEHKGGVENDIKYVKKNFWPEIKEKIKIFPQFSFNQAQESLESWDNEVANRRKIDKLNRSPAEIFSEEKAFLNPLPNNRWELTTWSQGIVGRDWRILYEGSYYSIPYMMIGQTIPFRITHQFLEFFYDGNLIAKHSKATFKGEYKRNPEHAPPFKEAVLNCTREGLLKNAKELGNEVYEFCYKILSERYVDKLRPVRKILSLAISYEAERLNNACKRALKYKTFSYRSIKDILKSGLDLAPTHQPVKIVENINFRFARDPNLYKSFENQKKEVL